MSTDLITGSFVALITPMNEDGTIDFEGFRTLIQFHAENGTSAILFMGSTGEVSMLSPDERHAIVRETMKMRTGGMHFYYGCTDAYAYDLAITLNAWCFDGDGGWRAGHADAMAAGYEAVRPLTPAERAALPTLLAGAAMRFLLTRLHDWLRPQPGSLQRPKDPLEQLACLRVHLNRETVR